jgi:hypothetical protein
MKRAKQIADGTRFGVHCEEKLQWVDHGCGL